MEPPEIHENYTYLAEFLCRIGVAGVGQGCLVPLTFQEIEAWARITQTELSWFEAEALHEMSVAYTSIKNDKSSDCPIDVSVSRAERDAANIAAWLEAAK